MKRAHFACFAVLALATSPALAQAGDEADVNALMMCAGIEDAAERLACFDAQVAAARTAPDPATGPAPVTPPPAPEPVDTAPNWAKAPEPDLTDEAFKQAESREPDEFAIEIVKVTRTRERKLRFYTDDGQVWEQLLSEEDWDLPDMLPARAEIRRRMVGKPVIKFDHRRKTYKVTRIE